MTIVVGVATPEGLVLASDSRMTSVADDGRHRIVSDSAQKVFRVGDTGVASFGAAFLGGETVGGLMDQFAASIDGVDLDSFDLSNRLRDFFTKAFRDTDEGRNWDPATEGYPIGFLVAGYDTDGIGHIRSVLVPDGDLDPDVSARTTTGGIMWQGQRDVVNRLLYGYDNERVEASGVEVPDDLQEVFTNLGYIQNAVVTIQDALDYAAFFVRTTVDMLRFSDGTFGTPKEVPGCGGPTQLLAIERSGPTWIAELKLSTPTRPGRGEEET